MNHCHDSTFDGATCLEEVEIRGHIIDSLILPKVLDHISANGGAFRIKQITGGRTLFVGGPAIIHTGSGESLCQLIRGGYIDVLFAGNALATHDIEQALFGTSLGVYLDRGGLAEAGHDDLVCVDINPLTAIKLADRGTFQTVGLVTDVEPFLRVLIDELSALESTVTEKVRS